MFDPQNFTKIHATQVLSWKPAACACAAVHLQVLNNYDLAWKFHHTYFRTYTKLADTKYVHKVLPVLLHMTPGKLFFTFVPARF